MHVKIHSYVSKDTKRLFMQQRKNDFHTMIFLKKIHKYVSILEKIVFVFWIFDVIMQKNRDKTKFQVVYYVKQSFKCSENLTLLPDRVVLGWVSDTSEVSSLLFIIGWGIVIVRFVSVERQVGKSALFGFHSKQSSLKTYNSDVIVSLLSTDDIVHRFTMNDSEEYFVCHLKRLLKWIFSLDPARVRSQIQKY